MNHKTVQVRVGNFEEAIDEKIAPLIQEIWKAGIFTTNSCQENKPGIAWVQFGAAQDCIRFLDIVAEYDDELHSLYNRIARRWDDIKTPVAHWEYSVSPQDLAIKEWETEDGSIDESHPGVPSFEFSVSVRFPITDLPVLVDRLRRYNDMASRERGDHFRQHGTIPDFEVDDKIHERVLRRMKVRDSVPAVRSSASQINCSEG